MKIKSENYITIQGFMRTELGLTGNDLLVYAIIYGSSQDGDSRFSGSLQYLADWCGATKQGIQKNLKNLLDRGLIKKETRLVNGINLVAYYTTELHTIQLSCINNTNISSNNTNKQQELFNTNNKEVLEVRKKDRVQWFVDNYNSICVSLPKCVRLTAKRSKSISNILKKFTDEEILEVFKKLEESDFCTNRSGKGWKADIDFILREDKFVSVLEGKYDNKSTGRSGKSVETTSLKEGETARVVSKEEREELRRMVERGELEEY